MSADHVETETSDVAPELRLFRQGAIPAPRPADIEALAGELGFTCNEEELSTYTEHVTRALAAYHSLDELVEPKLPVKYARTAGYMPQPEDNTCNAWAWRCDIPGALGDDKLLSGMTVAIKDCVPVAGLPMVNGSHMLRGYVADVDATVVTRILDNGGRIVGKAVCENLCLSGNSFTSASGPVTNPRNPRYSAGGSSSGTAALVAAGCVDVGIGGDQGGSIRIPSSWCGLVGLKPTHGLVPYTGAMSLEPTLDHLGPIARNVTDCAKLLQAIAGYDDGRDHRQHPSLTVPNYVAKLTPSCSGIKIGAVTEGFDFCTAEVKSAVRSALKLLSDNGVQVEDVSIPIHELGNAIFFAVCAEGGYHTRNGVGVGHRGYYNTSLNDRMSRALRTDAGCGAPHTVRYLNLLAAYVRSRYPGHYYCKAQNLVLRQRSVYDSVLQRYSVLVMPTIPTPAKPLPTMDQLTVSGYLDAALGNIIPNTAPFDNSGHPALTINCGYVRGADDGSGGSGDLLLPVGMMIVGRHYDEQTVLNVARAYERLRDAADTSLTSD